MEQFSTEEQQVEAIKAFWKKNGVAIVLGAVLGLGGMVGWRMYSDAALQTQEANSESYDQVVSGESLALDTLTEFVANNNHGYGVLAALSAAKLAVDEGAFDEAQKQLNWVLNNAKDDALKDTAAIRLARIQAQNGDFEQALTTLARVRETALVAQVNEVKGDIYIGLGDSEQARNAYQKAIDVDANNQLVQMKLDNLPQAVKG